jgi:formylglycine-generating enzyme required for sulfatase activity
VLGIIGRSALCSETPAENRRSASLAACSQRLVEVSSTVVFLRSAAMRSRFVQVLVPTAAVLALVVAVRHANAQAKPPVPVAELQESAKKAAGELYGKQFQQAKTTAEKAALATEMIEAAMKVQGGSPDQYVLLKIAADVAAGAGDAATALQAVEKMVERFDVPAPKLCAETLLAAAGNATMTSQHKAVAEAALKIADAVADAEDYALALSLCELAKSSAHKARQGPLAKELAAKIEDFQKRQSAFQEYQAAWALMQDDPAEPGANLAAGRYLCLVKGDWKRGVSMLALGSDAALKAVALMELRGADSAEQQAAIGNAWWDAAETRQSAERDSLWLRAGTWYRQAEPKLAGGLAGLKIKQRLAEISKLGREIPAASRTLAASQSPPLAIAPFDEKTAKQHQAAWAKHLKVPVLWTNTIGMSFVLIPPGEFDMGSTAEEVARLLGEAKEKSLPSWYIDFLPSEAPKHRVRITRPFYLGIGEVTQAEYERVMGSNPSQFKGDPIRPVEMVNWDEASAFCRKLGELPPEQTARTVYRLPTEAEWEFACRAGTTTTWSSGDDEALLKEHAWFSGNSGGTTHPVRQKAPNSWGLYDMHGNLWEWCQDGYQDQLPGGVDPAVAQSASARVIRSGSCSGSAAYCRSAFRRGDSPSIRGVNLGFRLVSVLAGTPGK